MAKSYHHLTWVSSLVLRISTFVFLRWIPGHHFPPIIIGSFLTYLYSFFKTATDLEYYDPVPVAEVESIQHRLVSPENAIADTPESDSESENRQVEVVTIDDAVVYAERPHVWRALLAGLPSPDSFWSKVALATNALLLLMTLDMVYRGPLLYSGDDLSFTRVGYVSHNNAKILVREPDPDQMPLYIYYKAVEDANHHPIDATWNLAGKVYSLDEDTDYTYAVNITKLQPSTRYTYSISNGHSGDLTTAPPPGSSKLSFITSSCIKPRFPYSLFDHPLRIAGLEILATWIPALKPSFMLFLGDFIYIDVPRRLGTAVETYRAEYRRTYASPSWSNETRSLPWIHVIDDHEIANDWDHGWENPYPAAIDPFNIYHHSVNPPHLGNASYYTFTQGPASFFLLDTRRYRTPAQGKTNTDAGKSMLGPKQLQQVLHWLSRSEATGIRWKILVSSVPFTRNWRVNAQDTWAGYLAERQTLLEAMWDATSARNGPGIVVLSGDRHEFAATSFPAPAHEGGRWNPGAKVTEFSCSPLNMFYLPVRSYREVVGEQSGVGAGGEDRVLSYIPDGNVKFGAVEIENEVGSGQSTLRYRVIVDGEQRWSHVITTLDGKEGARDAMWG